MDEEKKPDRGIYYIGGVLLKCGNLRKCQSTNIDFLTELYKEYALRGKTDTAEALCIKNKLLDAIDLEKETLKWAYGKADKRRKRIFSPAVRRLVECGVEQPIFDDLGDYVGEKLGAGELLRKCGVRDPTMHMKREVVAWLRSRGFRRTLYDRKWYVRITDPPEVQF